MNPLVASDNWKWDQPTAYMSLFEKHPKDSADKRKTDSFLDQNKKLWPLLYEGWSELFIQILSNAKQQLWLLYYPMKCLKQFVVVHTQRKESKGASWLSPATVHKYSRWDLPEVTEKPIQSQSPLSFFVRRRVSWAAVSSASLPYL